MAEKTVIAKVTLGVHCPKKSVPLKVMDDDTKKLKAVPGEFATVVLKHVPPGEKVSIDGDEADELVRLGFAEFPKAEKAEKATPAA